jgi:hypothetical protein
MKMTRFAFPRLKLTRHYLGGCRFYRHRGVGINRLCG